MAGLDRDDLVAWVTTAFGAVGAVLLMAGALAGAGGAAAGPAVMYLGLALLLASAALAALLFVPGRRREAP